MLELNPSILFSLSSSFCRTLMSPCSGGTGSSCPQEGRHWERAACCAGKARAWQMSAFFRVLIFFFSPTHACVQHQLGIRRVHHLLPSQLAFLPDISSNITSRSFTQLPLQQKGEKGKKKITEMFYPPSVEYGISCIVLWVSGIGKSPV